MKCVQRRHKSVENIERSVRDIRGITEKLIYRMKYYSAIKRNKIMPLAAT